MLFFQNRVKANVASLSCISILNNDLIETILTNCLDQIKASLSNHSDEWKKLYPGKELFNRYAAFQNIHPRNFINSLIKSLAHKPEAIPSELQTVLQTIREGTTNNQLVGK